MAIAEILSMAQSGAFDAAQATRAYLDAMPADQAAQTADYHEGQIWLIPISTAVSLLIYWLTLQTGFVRGLRDKLEAMMPNWLSIFPFIFVFTLVTSIVSLPFTYYVAFIREHKYGLATQTTTEWMIEWAQGLGLSLIIGTLALGILYLLIRAFKRTWWIWGTVASAAFIYAMMTFSPAYIDPIFNDYTPLEEGQLRDDLLAMAASENIPVDDVVVYTSSDQSNRITANVSGIGDSIRIALGDTMIDQAELDEIRYVMAHEMGHYKLGHTTRGIVFLSSMALLGFVFVHFGFGWANRRFGGSWGIRDIGDVAGMPLFFGILAIFSTLMTPIQYNYVRIGEVEADIFGLEISRNPDGMATSALRLSTYRELEPEPWEELLFRHHPSGSSRITMAMEWKAAQLAAGADDQNTDLELERARSIFEIDEADSD